MYDVVYIDEGEHCAVLAAGLSRESAVETARAEAKRRGAPRMFLRGSISFPRGRAVVIIRSGPRRSSQGSAPDGDGERPG